MKNIKEQKQKDKRAASGGRHAAAPYCTARTSSHVVSSSSVWGLGNIALCFLLCFFLAIPVTAQDREHGTEHLLGKKKITVVPDHMLRGYDPITVFFPNKPGPAKGGPLDKPGKRFQITPTHPGEYRRLDARTLQFLPTTPWPALEKYKITIDGKTFNLTTLMAPPRTLKPADNTQHLEPVKELNLSFAHRIEPTRLARMIRLETRPLPGVSKEKSQWLTSKDFVIKEMERDAIDNPVRYRVTLHKPIGYGKQTTLHLRLSLDGNIPGSLSRYTFSTKPLFRINYIGSGSQTYPIASRGGVYPIEQAMDCGTGGGRLKLLFSDNLGPVSINQVKHMVRFSPAVRNFRYNVSGTALDLMFDADRDKPYQVHLEYVSLKNSSGRQLAPFGPTSVYFFYRQAQPYLKWLAGQGIIERFGPQFFPMQGRNMDQVDVRVYKINALNRNFWPFPAEPVVLDESKRPPGPGEEPDYTSKMREQIKLLGSPLVSKVVPLPLKTGTGMRFGLDLKKHLASISGKDRPGSYLVGYRVIGTGAQRHYVRIQVTDISLCTVEEETAVAFVVNSLKTGAPIAGAIVEVQFHLEGDLESLIKGTTDANGIYRYVHNAELEYTVGRIIVSKGKDSLVLDPESAPPRFVSNHWHNSYGRWLSWLSGRPRTVKARAAERAHILTERPVYRPEEPVHIKGYVRNRKQGKIIPALQNRLRSVIVYGPGGKRWTFPVKTLGEYGSFYVKFDEKDLPTGDYRAEIHDTKKNLRLASVEFKKEAYRIPRFEVNLSSPARVALDEPFKVSLAAGYYAGGPVVGQDVQWRVSQYPYRYSLPGYPGFLFSSDERFSGRRSRDSYGVITKDDVTDDNGGAYIDIDPTLEEDSRPRKYVVEATVRGADEQTVTATRSVAALSPFVLGLKLERFIRSGTVIKPQVLVVDHNGEFLAGKEFHIKLLQRQWHSHLQESDFTTGKAKYVTDVVDKLIFQSDDVSESGPKTLSLPVKESGVYVVEISARDKQGRLQKVQADLYVAGDTPVSWKKPKANVFETTADKSKYNPGDTASVILKSPFQEAHGLVVVEEPSRNTYHWVKVSKGQGVFHLRISGDMHPDIPIHFLLMRGRLPGKTRRLEAGREDRGKPISMANTIRLRVNPLDNQLKISLDHPKKNLPGSKIQMKIKMTTPGGKPLNGEVTLWLVDRAVLALGKEKRLDPLPSFIDPTRSWITLRETRNLVVGNLSLEEVPGGDGDEAEEPSIFEKVTVRKNFKTVPYYNPSVIVKNGVAVVTIELPDNLTDFAVRAVATDGYGRFGAVKSRLSIRLPVIIQSALPRFVRPGDRFVAGGIGRVVEGEGGPGSGELQVEGLTLQGDAKKPIDWVKGRPEKVFFPLQVPLDALNPPQSGVQGPPALGAPRAGAPGGPPEANVLVRLAVKRTADKAMDAFEVKLPVRADKEPVRVERFVEMKRGKYYTFPAAEYGVRVGSMEQTLVVTPEAGMVKMLAALNFLARYEHGCTEQRISKIFPEIALKDVMRKIGREIHTVEMKRLMAETFTYLETCLKTSGLYSFWPGSRGYVSLTAYVVEFLLAVKQAGYEFDPKLLDRGIAALKASLRSDYSRFIDGYSFVERAEALSVLSLAGHFDDAYAHDLMARATSMDLYSESRILYSFLTQKKPYKKAVDRLSGDLWKSLIFKLRDGAEVYDGLQYRSRGWGGLILSSETKTMATVARALYKAEPANSRGRLLIDELVNLGTGDGWGSTNANAVSLMALGDVLGQAKPRKDGYRFRTVFGEEKKEVDTKGEVVTRVFSRSGTPGRFKLLSGPKKEVPLAWLSMQYVPAGTGDTIKARNEGFVVSRELNVYRAEGQPPDRYPAEAGKTVTLDMGTVVEEHIRVINGERRFYVAIKAPFAAGFEPLNPNLETAPPEAKPSGSFTRQPDYALYADDAVTFYFDELPKGTYDFYFRLRTGVEGSFTHPAAKAELMYQLAVRGNSDGTRIVVKKREEDK